MGTEHNLVGTHVSSVPTLGGWDMNGIVKKRKIVERSKDLCAINPHGCWVLMPLKEKSTNFDATWAVLSCLSDFFIVPEEAKVFNFTISNKPSPEAVEAMFMLYARKDKSGSEVCVTSGNFIAIRSTSESKVKVINFNYELQKWCDACIFDKLLTNVSLNKLHSVKYPNEATLPVRVYIGLEWE